MENSVFESKENSASGDQRARLLAIERCVKYLVHACHCRDKNCRLPSCHKMKRVVQHAKSCKKETNVECPICKQLIALCCYHAKYCQEAKCPVPFCVNIKNKLKQQRSQRKLHEEQNLKGLITTMQNHGMSDDVLQSSPENSNSSSQQRSTQAWQQLLQVLKSPPSAQQQQEVLAILKTNPQLMAAFIKQRTAQQQKEQQQLQLEQEQQQLQLQPEQQQQMLLNEGYIISPPLLNVGHLQPQQQHLLDMQRQQQQSNQLAHPQPPIHSQDIYKSSRMNFELQHRFQGDESQLQFQQPPWQLMQQQMKQMTSPTYPPVIPQQQRMSLNEDNQQDVQQVQAAVARQTVPHIVAVNHVTTPEITKPAPDFEGIAVINGAIKNIKLSDYKGKYVVLFFYPSVSTVVCPVEIIAFSEKVEEFKKLNCEVIGCSTDSYFSHLHWINTPREEGGLGIMNIPLLADVNCKISKDYGVVCKENEDLTFRGLFIIDGNGILRQFTISDLPVDKSVDETLHFVQVFQQRDQCA